MDINTLKNVLIKSIVLLCYSCCMVIMISYLYHFCGYSCSSTSKFGALHVRNILNTLLIFLSIAESVAYTTYRVMCVYQCKYRVYIRSARIGVVRRSQGTHWSTTMDVPLGRRKISAEGGPVRKTSLVLSKSDIAEIKVRKQSANLLQLQQLHLLHQHPQLQSIRQNQVRLKFNRRDDLF